MPAADHPSIDQILREMIALSENVPETQVFRASFMLADVIERLGPDGDPEMVMQLMGLGAMLWQKSGIIGEARPDIS